MRAARARRARAGRARAGRGEREREGGEGETHAVPAPAQHVLARLEASRDLNGVNDLNRIVPVTRALADWAVAGACFEKRSLQLSTKTRSIKDFGQ